MDEAAESMSCCLWWWLAVDFLPCVAGNPGSCGDGKGPWGKQTCERSMVRDQLLTYWGPRSQSIKTQKELSKITYRFYTPYSKIDILRYLSHCVWGDTIIQSKTKYSWIAMWHIKLCLRCHQPLDLKLPSSQYQTTNPLNFNRKPTLLCNRDKMLDIHIVYLPNQKKKKWNSMDWGYEEMLGI